MRGKKKSRRLAGLSCLMFVLCAAVLMMTGCGTKGVDYPDDVKTRIIRDSAGREVEVPEEITKIAPSGNVSQMILMTIAPEKMVGLSQTPSVNQKDYIPEELWTLPTFGAVYGQKSNLNMEALLKADPDVIIDLGDRKDTIRSDMDYVQNQTGIATVFIEADIYHLKEAYQMLGYLLGKEDRGQALSEYVGKTIAMCAENKVKIPDEDRVSVMYGTGSAGLACNARGSSQAYVIDIVGAENAVVIPEDELSNKGGGNTISMEQLYNFDPDVIVLQEGGPFDSLSDYPEWQQLTAVLNDHYYEIPMEPYCWLSNPPSVNQVLGIYWLGNLLYPDIYDYDMAEVTKEFCQLFWGAELSDEKVDSLLENSSYKVRK
ncbi:MAG: ABC transporter substrate-binding protein [Firmicutes bacterium]|nr:ABC transporter substrate-binding protein [Bacillota bacterium]